MDTNRLREIGYRLPDSSATARAFLDGLVELLGGVPVLSPVYPAGALPVTSVSLASVRGPEVVFEPGPAIDLTVGPLQLRGSTVDSAGSVVADGGWAPDVLPMDELVRRLRGNLLGVDHTGVNLPSVELPRDGWDRLLASLAPATNVYRYPTGEDWPFVIGCGSFPGRGCHGSGTVLFA
jgi:hypothetical protein